MIYVGYPGIGKSTLASKRLDVIDLESSLFRNIGDNWAEFYVGVAQHLSTDGKIVFLSTHKNVRDELNKRGITYKVIHPSLALKDEWIDKLSARVYDSKQNGSQEECEKNGRALLRAQLHYEDDVEDLMREDVPKIVIDDINYVLEKII